MQTNAYLLHPGLKLSLVHHSRQDIYIPYRSWLLVANAKEVTDSLQGIG